MTTSDNEDLFHDSSDESDHTENVGRSNRPKKKSEKKAKESHEKSNSSREGRHEKSTRSSSKPRSFSKPRSSSKPRRSKSSSKKANSTPNLMAKPSLVSGEDNGGSRSKKKNGDKDEPTEDKKKPRGRRLSKDDLQASGDGFEKPPLRRRERSLVPDLTDTDTIIEKVQAGEKISTSAALLLTIDKMKKKLEKAREDQDQLIYKVEQLELVLDTKESRINELRTRKVPRNQVKDFNLMLKNLSITKDFDKQYTLYRSSVESFLEGMRNQNVTHSLPEYKNESSLSQRLKAGEVLGNEEALSLMLDKLMAHTEQMDEVRQKLLYKIGEMDALLEDKEAKVKALQLFFQEPEQPKVEKEEKIDLKLKVEELSADDAEELDDILENLDIDGDFDLVGPSSPPNEATEQEHWKEQMDREEVFSLRYRPSKLELIELDELERDLQLKPPSSNLVASFLETTMDPNKVVWKRLAHPEPQDPASIILKRGHILYEDFTEEEKDAELIFLTHGFVVATTTKDKKGKESYKLERALEWTTLLSAKQIQDKQCAWQMMIKQSDGQGRLVFIASDPIQYAVWMEALELIVVNSHMHDTDSPKDPGWQHKIIRKPAFTMAVLGVEDDLPIRKNDLDELDSYNGFSPLHYAIRLRHEKIVKRLLEKGADPNLEDGDGLTPVYHAIHDEAPDSYITLLKKFKGKNIDKMKREKKDLNQRVTATKNDRALVAQANMSENMRLLQERGIKIDEAADKARLMNENAAEYKDLAKKLKQKTQDQASWNPLARTKK